MPCGGSVSELPSVLVIEDEYLLQADLEKVLTEAGFASKIVSSGEEALTLFMGGTVNCSALITDVRLRGRMSGWEAAKRIRERPGLTHHLRHWRSCGRMGCKRRSE